MTAYALTTPDRDGNVVAGAAVSGTDTITRAVLGQRGVILEIINGNASPDTVTISDATTTRSGAAASAISKAVANGTAQVFLVLPQQADPITKVVSLTHSVTSTVTYKMYPR
jgi:hypothetical protein